MVRLSATGMAVVNVAKGAI